MIAKITSAPIYLLPVVKIARKGTLLGGLNEDTETFGPLKVILQAIPALFANRDVRLRSPTQWHSPLTGTFQETGAVGNKIENLLSRVVAVEDHFNSRPSDVAEQRRRDELIRYAMSSIMFSADPLPAS